MPVGALQSTPEQDVNQPRDISIESLLAITPAAVRAQMQMDSHHGGYRNRRERLMELITFNDMFVDVVLGLSDEARMHFTEDLFAQMSRYCAKRREPMFSREQFDAIVHGLAREIAVYEAALAQGYDAHMTSRQADSMGIDMQIRSPISRRYINIDCKMPASYRHRLHDLLREGRISEADAVQGMVDGFMQVVHGHGAERVKVVLLRIDPADYGEIHHYKFVDSEKIGEMLRVIIDAHGLSDDDFYRYDAPDD